MNRRLIQDIKETLEIELLKSLSNKKKEPVIVKKVPVSNRFLDTQRQEDVLDRMLEHYRLQNYKRETREYIKNISRSEPDYYTLKMTSDFIDQLLSEYSRKFNIKLEQREI
jgi:hypothetical protein